MQGSPQQIEKWVKCGNIERLQSDRCYVNSPTCINSAICPEYSRILNPGHRVTRQYCCYVCFCIPRMRVLFGATFSASIYTYRVPVKFTIITLKVHNYHDIHQGLRTYEGPYCEGWFLLFR
jgi:hypothetical protein